jgi:hypothetical protein
VLIYVEHISSRLKYTLDFVFSDRQIAYTLCNDGLRFMAASGPKLNYSERYFEACQSLTPATVLFDEGLYQGSIEKALYHQEECLSFNGICDPLASIFYILSRMEEYGSLHVDEKGRFEAKASVLTKFGWLDKLVCERWSLDFIHALEATFQIQLPQKPLRFTFQPTFDIDNAFAYAHKNKVRTVLAALKDRIYGRKQRLLDREAVRKGLAPDPYDSFDQILAIANEHAETKVFWLLGNYTRLDKNLSHLHPKQAKWIETLSKQLEIGIHGSSLTKNSAYQLQEEMERLAAITGYRPLSNRQHFLLLDLPTSYRQLMACGIEHDYTMGYAEQCGFRAGTARVFKWFDLGTNEKTSLSIHPFCYMDGTLHEYEKLSPDQAKLRIEALFQEVKTYGGTFSFLWHNETITDYQHWKGWKQVFEFSLELGVY